MANVMTSPGFSQAGSSIPRATPGGVPVVITSPGSKIINSGNIRQDVRYFENHGRRTSGLTPDAVNLEAHGQIVDITQFICRYQPRPQWPKRLGTFALHPLPTAFCLKVAFRYVVANSVASDVGGSVRFVDISRTLANDECQFYFPI